MTEKDPKTATFVIISGGHSRIEAGEYKKYQSGDLIELSEQESLIIRDKIMSVSEFEERVKAHERNEILSKEAEEILHPPVAPRDPESVERSEQIAAMRKPGRTTGLT